MSKVTLGLLGVACLSLLACPAAFSQTQPPPTQQNAAATMAQQGQAMVDQGAALIQQGQAMQENGRKLIQQSGVTPPATGSTVQSTTQTTTTSPASPALNPSDLLKNVGQYKEYIQQGQKILKNPQKFSPNSK
jgi:hypothetical protein